MNYLDAALKRIGVAAAIFLLSFLIAASAYASATTPCPPLLYSVAYTSPLCVVTLTQWTSSLPLTYVWWLNWWNNYTWEQVSQHVGRAATDVERITYQDTDGNAYLSASDSIEIWNTACGGGLVVQFSNNATDTRSFTQTVVLNEGYQLTCGTQGQDLVTPILIGLVIVAAFALPTDVFIVLWRRLWR